MAQNNLPAQRGEEQSIATMLNQSIPAFKLALPKSMDPERMARIALTTIRRNRDLVNCNAQSLVGAVLESASLGLEIDSRGLAYLVPYKREATLIVGYKGLMQLAYRSGKITNIYADVVFRKEVEAGKVGITLGAERSLRHDFDILASAPMREVAADNPPVLAYAVAVFRDGAKHFEFVTEAEVKKRKAASAASGGGFLWSKWLEEAWKKTAIRKLCKYMDLSPEVQRAVVLDEQAESETKRQNFDFAGSIDVDFSTNGVAEDDIDYDTASFNEAMAANGISPDDPDLAEFVKQAAELNRSPADKVKVEAATDIEDFLSGFKGWLDKRKPQEQPRQTKKAQAESEPQGEPEHPAESPMIECPKTGEMVSRTGECQPCKKRETDCPHWATAE